MSALELSSADAIPALGLGTWKSAPGEVGAAVAEALRLGYRHIDCASIYGNEAEIGAALERCWRTGAVARADVWITSKLWCDAHASADVEPALRATLAALRLDYLDLYLMHWPVALKPGVVMPRSAADMIAPDGLPVAVTWRAMERLVDLGLVRHIGVSNFSVEKLAALRREARLAPEVNQVEMHPYLPQDALYDYCKANGIALTAYSPFGSRDRAASMKQPDEPDLFADRVIGAIAAAHRAAPAQVILSWLLGRGVATIPKSVSPVRLAQNFEAQRIELGPDEMQRIAAIGRRFRYVTGKFWILEGGPYTLASLWDEPPHQRA